MNPWQVLGIEPTGDAKAIKKAYAVLVKKNKPDENPEGFAQLHKAYKHCAAMAKRMTAQAAPTVPEVTADTPSAESATNAQAAENVRGNSLANTAQHNIDSEYDISAPVSSITIAKSLEELADNSDEQATSHLSLRPPLPETDTPTPEAESLPSQVINAPFQDTEELPPIDFEQAQQELIAATERAFTRLKEQDVLEHWQFIEHCDALYDFSFKSGYSDYLLEQLIKFFANTKVVPSRRRNVIFYLNQQFDWLSQLERYEERWSYETIAPVFNVLLDAPRLEERALKWIVDARHNGPIEIANYYARLIATIVDFIIFALLASLIGDQLTFAEKVLYLPLLFITLKACLEASPLQGSPGQVLFGMKVTSKKGRRINIIQSLWRQLVYATSMVTFKITVWINLFMRGGRLLHDRLSGTSVIKR